MKVFLVFLLVMSYSYSADNHKESFKHYAYDPSKLCGMPEPVKAPDEILIEWVEKGKTKINQSNGSVSDFPESARKEVYYGCNLILTGMDRWLLGFIKRKVATGGIKNIHIFGCGHGNMVLPLIIATKKKDISVKIFASDLNPGNIQSTQILFNKFANDVGLRNKEQKRLFFATLNINDLPSSAHYNFTIIRNVLHFLLEDQVEKFAKKMFNKTAPGGYLYFSVQMPSGSKEFVNHVRTQQKLGNKDPGFIHATGYNFYVKLPDKFKQTIIGSINKDIVISGISRAKSGSVPGYQTAYSKKAPVEPGSGVGLICKKVVDEVDLKVCELVNQSNSFSYTSSEFVQNSYLPETIVPIFTKNGWLPLTVSYINFYGNIVSPPTDEELSKSVYYMYVLLQKPGVSKGNSCANKGGFNNRGNRYKRSGRRKKGRKNR